MNEVHLPLSTGTVSGNAILVLPPLVKEYQRSIELIGRLHAQFLNVITDELKRHGADNMTNIQALLLFNLGDQEMTVGALETRGHSLGANVTYNLKKLVEGGYIIRERSEPDRRIAMVSLSSKGIAIRDILDALFERHLNSIEIAGDVRSADLTDLNVTLKRIQRFWYDQVRFRA